MRKFYLKHICALIILVIFVSCSEDGNLESPSDVNSQILEEAINESYSPIPGQYIVTFKSNTLAKRPTKESKISYETAMSKVKTEVLTKFESLQIEKENLKATFGYALEGFVAVLSEKQVAELKKDPRVKSIESDYIIALAPPPGKGPGGGGGGTDPLQETPWGITRVGGAVNGTGKTAWIIDSGIDSDHPDLNVDVARSRSYVTKGSYSIEDGNGHGTHVAGTVAALDNGIGVIGVAPGASVVALRVLDNRGSGSFSWTVQALDYIASAASAGDAVNMSLGPRSRYTDSAVDAATLNVASLGIKIAIAAGNSSDDSAFYSPARNNHPNIYTVSAMDINDNWASFSNYGSPVDYAAPGVSVKSTYKDGGYASLSGTSMASPHVCGLLLLGNIVSDGFVNGDPDGNPDPIATHN